MRLPYLAGALTPFVAFATACDNSPTACGLGPECTVAASSAQGSGGNGGVASGSSGTGGTSTMVSSSQQGSASGGAAGSGGGGAGGQGGAGGADAVNGCLLADAQDYTGLAGSNPLILFPGPDPNAPVYTPSCIKIKQGQHVYFYGDFVTYPLSGGTVSETTITPDPTSPLNAPPAGDLGDFALDAGTFGFLTYPHWQTMHGTIFVLP